MQLFRNRPRTPTPRQSKFWRVTKRWGWQPHQPLGLVAIALVFSFSVLASCTQVPPPPLRVAVNLWPGYETLYLARSLGYYNNTPIQLVDLPSGTEEIRAFRNRNVEAAAVSLDQALVLAATDPQVRIITVMDFSEGGDVILAKPGISTLQALKGKRVGVEANVLGAYILTRALEQSGLSPQDIQVVSLGISEQERAFNNGGVDAVVTFGPVRSKLLSVGAKQLFDSSQIPGEIVDVLVVRGEAIAHQPEAVQMLVEGRFRALAYLSQHPQDAARRIAPRTGVTPEQFLESLRGLRSPSLAENQKLLGKVDPALLVSAKRLVQVMMANKLLSKTVDPAPLLDDRWVQKVQL